MKILILTSICDSKNLLVDPIEKYDGVDYIAFVDRHYDCSVWQQKIAFDFTTDEKYKGRRNAKIYKVLPHLMAPGYDYYFWVDSTHEVIQHPTKIIEEYLKDDILGVFKHLDRDCVYDEGKVVLSCRIDKPELVNSQLEYYESVEYPRNNGLWELPALIRKNTPQTQVMNLRWWEQICKYSSRDQISFPFVLHSLNITPVVLPGYAFGEKYVLDEYSNPLMTQKRGKIY
jgi:hypothetical protein